MVKEEITINELLSNFNLKLKLSERLLEYNVSSDFLKSELNKDKNSYTFSVDSVELIINPKNKKETIKKLVFNNDNIMGGVILNDNSIVYLN